ncbi:unnamed protein product [Cylindrotheca closterium]|uniref:Uncharacterized protein n=1 Tax=Cylindrotheca closterium TaxID=2856 RepID=A0AAD2JLG4_9STRA|nr:unnamed protein product [Cylindrotheca closterium]
MKDDIINNYKDDDPNPRKRQVATVGLQSGKRIKMDEWLAYHGTRQFRIDDDHYQCLERQRRGKNGGRMNSYRKSVCHARCHKDWIRIMHYLGQCVRGNQYKFWMYDVCSTLKASNETLRSLDLILSCRSLALFTLGSEASSISELRILNSNLDCKLQTKPV